MKVELKLRSSDIGYLVTVMEVFAKTDAAAFHRSAQETKVIMSICIEIADKFADKFKKISRKVDLFDEGKKFTISLKYYEVYALATYLRGVELNETDTYRKMTAIKIMAYLNEKL